MYISDFKMDQDEPATVELLIDKHAKFLYRTLKILPQSSGIHLCFLIYKLLE